MRFRFPLPSHATVVAYVALFVALSGTAVAATGGTFLLGERNRARATSVLTNPVGTPLALAGPTSKAPLKVTSRTKVKNLNADTVDGLGAEDLLAAGGAPTFYEYGGQVPPIAPAGWSFLGSNYARITVSAGQRITGVSTAALQGSSEVVHVMTALCLASDSGGTPQPFRPETVQQPLFHGVGTSQQVDTATGTVVPGEGTWRVGYCLKTFNAFPQLLSNLDNVYGWFMVTSR